MHTKKEENRPIHRKEKWIESVSEEGQILDLKNKGLKSSISSLLKELEKVMYKELRKYITNTLDKYLWILNSRLNLAGVYIQNSLCTSFILKICL